MLKNALLQAILKICMVFIDIFACIAKLLQCVIEFFASFKLVQKLVNKYLSCTSSVLLIELIFQKLVQRPVLFPVTPVFQSFQMIIFDTILLPFSELQLECFAMSSMLDTLRLFCLSFIACLVREVHLNMSMISLTLRNKDSFIHNQKKAFFLVKSPF